jgi:DNA-binding XRE family transcriptional regulator
MQVVVKKPHIKFDISIDGNVPTTFLDKIANLVKEEYGNDVFVSYDDDEELIDVFQSDWYQETKDQMTPADYVKIYRENKNWTQDKLGQKLGGLTRQYISDLEKGRRGVSKDMAKKLSIIFDVPVERFL